MSKQKIRGKPRPSGNDARPLIFAIAVGLTLAFSLTIAAAWVPKSVGASPSAISEER